MLGIEMLKYGALASYADLLTHANVCDAFHSREETGAFSVDCNNNAARRCGVANCSHLI